MARTLTQRTVFEAATDPFSTWPLYPSSACFAGKQGLTGRMLEYATCFRLILGKKGSNKMRV